MKPLDMGGRKQFFTRQDFDGNGGEGRLVILCGSRPRLTSLSERLDVVETRDNPRGFDLIIGAYRASHGQKCDVAIVCTGIGAPSFDAVFHHLVRSGARRFIRLGTCGSMQPHLIRTGSVIIAEAAFRDEGASKNYIHASYPAVASPRLVMLAKEIAGEPSLTGHVYSGVVHTKDSIFAREFHLSLLASNDQFMQELRSAGIIATDMETSHFYVLSSLLSYQATENFTKPANAIESVALLAVVGDDTPFSADAGAIQAAEARAADLCFRLVVACVEREEREGGANETN